MSFIDEKSVNTIRVFSAEMITKAKSGHPGICLGAAPIMHTLFTRYINIDSESPNWFDRDRFVLSAGHGSALLYVMLHLSGFEISVEDLKEFRQLGSLTPGHPEYKHTPGVEITTGPLGQGISTAVGMAIAEKHLGAKFNRPDLEIVNHYTYVLCGDGDLQEGVTMEACSLAGRLQLEKLIVLFDSNDVQLDGPTSLATSDNIKGKFEAMGWNYLLVEDGNNCEEIAKQIEEARNNTSHKPTIIEIKTLIGYGAENSGESSVHGKPLSIEGLKILRENLGVKGEEFTIPEDVYNYYQKNVIARGNMANSHWNSELAQYEKKYPEDYEKFMHYMYNDFEVTDYELLPEYEVGTKVSTRKVMGAVTTALGRQVENMIGGSADLVSSTMVKGNEGNFDVDNYVGRNINFGVREHAMGAIVNGLTLSGLKGFGAGFFVFSDYMKPAIRLAALMKIPSIFLFSHDSVCVGEDGPTHQPIEQLANLRAVPNLNVVRPADAKEMTVAMLSAIDNNNEYPTVITSTRQDVEVLAETDAEGFGYGAYIAYETSKKKVDRIVISCGSELALCINAAKELEKEGIGVRVVSMPSMFIYERQTEEYKEKILPKHITKRLAVEMGASMPWYKYASKVLSIDTFGSSMPIKEIFDYYGFTVENVKSLIKKL